MADNAKTKAPAKTAEESAVKSILLPVVVLVAICVVCSALLAYLNGMTKPIIAENTRLATLEAYVSVLPAGTTPESLTDIENLTTAGVAGAVRSADGAVAVQAAAPGYSGKALTVYVAFDAAGNITNIQADASLQTTGIGSKTGEDGFTGGFIGWNAAQPVESGSPVDAIAGATVSSKAVFAAVNSAINCYNNELAGVATNG
ncbi:MAG: FMN-binding protein [Pygmaiobacter sp.]|nr:FMN-binding protein [Pygmaiobacter sp.]